MLLQDTSTGRGWPDVVNTLLLILGPILLGLMQWLIARGVKKASTADASSVKSEVQSAAKNVDDKLAGIKEDVNGNLHDAKLNLAVARSDLVNAKDQIVDLKGQIENKLLRPVEARTRSSDGK